MHEKRQLRNDQTPEKVRDAMGNPVALYAPGTGLLTHSLNTHEPLTLGRMATADESAGVVQKYITHFVDPTAAEVEDM